MQKASLPPVMTGAAKTGEQAFLAFLWLEYLDYKKTDYPENKHITGRLRNG